MILSLLLNKKTNTNESKTQQPFFNKKLSHDILDHFLEFFFYWEFPKKSSMSWKLLFVKIIVVAIKNTNIESTFELKLY